MTKQHMLAWCIAGPVLLLFIASFTIVFPFFWAFAVLDNGNWREWTPLYLTREMFEGLTE